MITAASVALGRAAARHRRAVIVLTLLFAAASAVVGHGVTGHLVTGGWAPAGASSLRADALLTEQFHGGVPDLALLARTSSGSVDSPPSARTAGAWWRGCSRTRRWPAPSRTGPAP
ncbi:hypothetical protein O1M54_02755 [Streptomyces diastatochromogenes]|nr:hypothetical protein [Streptomyces diastatochromogenes]